MPARPAAAAAAILLSLAAFPGPVDAAGRPEHPSAEQGFIEVGSFHLLPALALRNVGYDSNIFLSPEGEEIGDYTATLTPSLTAVTLFGHEGRLDIRQAFDFVAFLETSSQNHVNNLTDIDGWGFLGEFTVRGGFDYDSRKLRPNEEIDERVRQKIATLDGELSWSASARSEFGVLLQRQRYDYDADETLFGNSYADLNRDETTLAFQGRSRIRPKTDAVLLLSHTDIAHEEPLLGRDAVMDSFVPGFVFDASAVIQGQVSYGYQTLEPNEPGRTGYSGPVGEAVIGYRIGSRLRLGINYERNIVFSIFDNNLYFKRELFGFEAWQSLSRRFRLEAGASRTLVDYPVPVTSGATSGYRDDRVGRAWIGWSYAQPDKPRYGIRLMFWERDSTFDVYDTSQVLIIGAAQYAF
jgi:hypothetical protein